jgi:preprotein translocase subunit SecA
VPTAPPATYFLRPDPRAESTLGLGGWWARQLRELTLRALGRATVAGGGSTHRRQALALWNSLQPGAGIDGAPAPAEVAAVRAALRRRGAGRARHVPALALAARAGRAALGRMPYPTQLQAALILLDGNLAEMATGEGKTYAAALGAAVWALAGLPVHLMTANDYLVQRDAAEMRPLFEALGLSVGCVVAASTPEARRVAYACDVTYCTAREVAFDHLRDMHRGVAFRSELQQRVGGLHPAEAGGAEGPLLRGLWAAVVDEADCLLVDEAALPLLLSERLDAHLGSADAAARQRAIAFQSLTIARQLQPGEHFHLEPRSGRVRWTAAGEARVEAQAAALSGVWFNRRHRRDLLGHALHALHGLQADRDYVVVDRTIKLLDPVTGRPAEGRVWSRGLQAAVEMKEGCPLSPPTRVAARLSLQRFFCRYLRLAGMSGTLRESAGDLRAAYGCRVVVVPHRLASRLRREPDLVFATAERRRQAAVLRVQQLHAQGRPVLLATDSVQASQAMSHALEAVGVAHARLDARHDAAEAEVVAGAGHAGAVTVATQMAGRGTDILLSPGVAERGGLHVLCCQDNPSARLDRQVTGRAGRHGENGTAEVWRALDARAWQPGAGWAAAADRWVRARWLHALASRDAIAPGLLGRCWFAWRQSREEGLRSRQRRAEVDHDLQWQQRTGRSMV